MRRLCLTTTLALVLTGCFVASDDADELGESAGTESESSDEVESSSDSTSSSSTSSSTSTEGTSEDTTSESTTTTSEESTDTGPSIQGEYGPCIAGECPEGAFCNSLTKGSFVFDTCAPSGCFETADCPAPPPGIGQFVECIAGNCVPVCQSNADCGPGLVCSLEGQCLHNAAWGPCSANNDCPMMTVCEQFNGGSSCFPQCMGSCPAAPIGGDPAQCNPNSEECQISCTMGGGECPPPMACFGGVCMFDGVNP